MSDAFEGVVAALGIGPQEETRRNAVAQFIITMVRSDDGTDLTTLRARAITALRGASH